MNSQTPQPQQPTEKGGIKIELQKDRNGFKTLQNLVIPNKPNKPQQPNQPQALNPNNDLTEYIGRNIDMTTMVCLPSLRLKTFLSWIMSNTLRAGLRNTKSEFKNYRST